jgi:hypothetical protein
VLGTTRSLVAPLRQKAAETLDQSIFGDLAEPRRDDRPEALPCEGTPNGSGVPRRLMVE